MRQQNALHRQLLAPHDLEQLLHLVARIDEHRLPCLLRRRRRIRSSGRAALRESRRSLLTHPGRARQARTPTRQSPRSKTRVRPRSAALPPRARRLGAPPRRLRCAYRESRQHCEAPPRWSRRSAIDCSTLAASIRPTICSSSAGPSVQGAQHSTPRALPAREHLEQHRSERVDVAPRVCQAARDISSGDDVRRGGVQPRDPAGRKARQAEVHEFRAILRRNHDRIGP